ncbi:MAG TPA: hypothetical protein VGX91_07780 [Candidatus Cybelea sp.]|nr:hypothetical protein [Candidatus Cybelea sp.]
MIFSGEYDISVRSQLRIDLARIAATPKVVFDLSEVTFVDAGTIGELMRFHDMRAFMQLQRETIVAQDPHVVKILHLMNVGTLFSLTESLLLAVPRFERVALQYARSVAAQEVPVSVVHRNGAVGRTPPEDFEKGSGPSQMAS